MKTCPVCGAKSFSDMEICYGCMHRFGEPEEDDFVEQPIVCERPGEQNPGAISPLSPKESEEKAEKGDEACVSCVEPVLLPACDRGYSLVISIRPV